MIHRPSNSHHLFRWPIALAALGFLAGMPMGFGSVPANPPAKPELGGAAAAKPAPAAPSPPTPQPSNPPRSIPAVAVAATQPNSEIAGILRYGASLTDRGDYSTAEIAFWQVLNRSDATVDDQINALFGLARMYRREDKLTQAAAIYERFLKDHPEDRRVPDALLELGRTLRDMGAYGMAFNAFYNVINSTLKFPQQAATPAEVAAILAHYEQLAHTAQFEIAETHFESGNYAEAAQYFLKVHNLDLAPADKAKAQFMAAYSQQRAGEYETAVATLGSFLDLWPNDQYAPEARYLLATVLRQLNRPEEAMRVTLDLLTEVRASDGGDSPQWRYWQKRTGNEIANDFFQSGNVLEALSIYQGLAGLSSDPDWRLPVTYQIALCYDRLAQTDKATQAYQAVIAGGTAKPGAPAPSPELAELARMATWRLAHLDWVDKTQHEFTTLFQNDGPLPPPPADQTSKPPPS